MMLGLFWGEAVLPLVSQNHPTWHHETRSQLGLLWGFKASAKSSPWRTRAPSLQMSAPIVTVCEPWASSHVSDHFPPPSHRSTRWHNFPGPPSLGFYDTILNFPLISWPWTWEASHPQSGMEVSEDTEPLIPRSEISASRILKEYICCLKYAAHGVLLWQTWKIKATCHLLTGPKCTGQTKDKDLQKDHTRTWRREGLAHFDPWI